MDLSSIYIERGKMAPAEMMLKKALEGCRRNLADNDSETLSTMRNLGSLYLIMGKIDQAEALSKGWKDSVARWARNTWTRCGR